jgi:hypothetical protein
MLIVRLIPRSSLIQVIFLMALFPPSIIAQNDNTRAFSASELLQMMADQPAHIGERKIVANTAHERWNFAIRLNKVRKEFYPLEKSRTLIDQADKNYRIITISEIGQPSLAYDPQAKTRTRLPNDFKVAGLDLYGWVSSVVSGTNEVKIEEVGTTLIEGHEARKISIKYRSQEGNVLQFRGVMILYFANDLKNLLIKLESDSAVEKGTERPYVQRSVYTLSNISLDVPDDLFKIPTAYKEVEFDAFWAAIKAAH